MAQKQVYLWKAEAETIQLSLGSLFLALILDGDISDQIYLKDTVSLNKMTSFSLYFFKNYLAKVNFGRAYIPAIRRATDKSNGCVQSST